MAFRCPDRTLSQARKYIFDSLGAEYLESTVLDLESMLEESDNRTPLICLLSTGSDPSPQIEAIAKIRCQEMRQLSMGQGQEEAARKLLTDSIVLGHWLLLQVRLESSFLAHLLSLLCSLMIQLSTRNLNQAMAKTGPGVKAGCYQWSIFSATHYARLGFKKAS